MKGVEKIHKGKRISKKKLSNESGAQLSKLDDLGSTGTTCLLAQLKEKIADASEESYIEFDCPVEDYLGEIYDIIKYDCRDGLNDIFFKKPFLELRKWI
jgi:hypothetical protein